MKLFRKIVLSTSSIGLLLLIGCGETKQSETVTESPKKEALSAGTDFSVSKVASITFVGQKDACKCTKDRITGSLAALESVMKDAPQIKVKKIQLDVEQDEADKLDDQKSLIVAPGIYFFDEKGTLMEMLQGEVREDQIAGALL